MIFLLDTSVLIDVLRFRQERRSFIDGLSAAGHTLATSAVNIAEVYAGMRTNEEDSTNSLLSSLLCYPVTRAVATRAGHFQRVYARQGRTFALIDMLVAATALEFGLTLVTDNRKDFPMAELQMHPLPPASR